MNFLTILFVIVLFHLFKNKVFKKEITKGLLLFVGVIAAFSIWSMAVDFKQALFPKYSLRSNAIRYAKGRDVSIRQGSNSRSRFLFFYLPMYSRPTPKRPSRYKPSSYSSSGRRSPSGGGYSYGK